jgi:hypothetical protein
MRDCDRWTKNQLRLLACWLLFVTTTLAHAQTEVGTAEAKAKARQFYEDGVTNYNLGHFTQALGAFEAGYRLRRDPSFLFNIAQCERNLNQYQDAERTYRSYLRESPSLTNAERDRIQRLIDEMEKAIQAERAKQPPTGTQAPAGASESKANSQSTDSGSQSTVVRSAHVGTQAPWYRSNVGWGLASIGLGATAAGAALLGATIAEHNSAAASTTQASFDQHHSNVLHFQQAGWPLLGVGAALVVAGVTVFVVHGKGHR